MGSELGVRNRVAKDAMDIDLLGLIKKLRILLEMEYFLGLELEIVVRQVPIMVGHRKVRSVHRQ